MTFRYENGDTVTVVVSGETGIVIGRGDYLITPLCSYLVRYKSADGRAVENWWTEDALTDPRPMPAPSPRGVKKRA